MAWLKKQVLLEVVYDDEESAHPQDWNWTELVGDPVRVIDFTEATPVPEGD